MKLLDTTRQTNWKFVTIVVIAAAVVSTGIFWYLQLTKQKCQQSETGEEIPTTVVSNTFIEDEAVTAKWARYTRADFGFEVKYPPNWIIAMENGDDGLVVEFVTDDTEELAKQGNSFLGSNLAIAVWSTISEHPEVRLNNRDVKTVDEFFKDNPTAEKTGEIIIDGRKAYEYSEGGYGLNYAVLIERDGQIYNFSFGRTWSKEYLSEAEEQIFSTFRFVGK